MANRIIGMILGYLIPMTLVIIFFFLIEFILEIGAQFVATFINFIAIEIFNLSLNLNMTWDFPGPLNLLNFLIIAFPPLWDIASTIWWSTVEDITFIIGAAIALIAAILGEYYVFMNLRNFFFGLSTIAGDKAKVKSRIEEGGYQGLTGDEADKFD